MRAWECSRCGEVYTSNPDGCPECGHNVFRPVSGRELKERSTGEKTVTPIDPEITVGTRPQERFESGPDVAPDGSLETSDPDTTQMDRGVLHRLWKLVGP